MNGCIHQIFEGRCHLLCLVEFSGLIRAKLCVAGSHAIDIMHFSKGGGPMGLPVGPSVVDRWATFPLVPGQQHVAACQGVLGTCGDHGFVGEGATGIGGKDLTFLLFSCVDGKGVAGVDAGIVVCHGVIQISFADLGIGVEDVHVTGAEINGVETFSGVIKNGIVDVVNCRRELVACDGEDHCRCSMPCKRQHWRRIVPCGWRSWRLLG